MTNIYNFDKRNLNADKRQPIGQIGLGLMGGVIARRLTKCHYTVCGADVSEDARSRFDQIVRTSHVATAGDVFANCRRVILSLPSHQEVSEVLTAERNRFRDQQIIIDTTTGDPARVTRTALELADRNVQYIDATVSGSSRQLEAGDVTWMIGGEAAIVAECHDIFDALRGRAFHVGRAGSGSKMKLVTNLILGLNRAALAEGLVLAESLGLDLSESLRVLRESPAYSRMMDTKGQKMLDRDFSTQARLSQHMKDVQLMLNAAKDTSAPLRLTEAHLSILQGAVDMGLGDADNSALIEFMRKDLTKK